MPTKRGLKADCVRKSGVVTPHEQMIRDLCASHPEIYRNGFWRSVEALAKEVDADDDCSERLSFLPDAYRINRERRTIDMHEVVVWKDVDRRKRIAMGLFWMRWDGDDYDDWIPRLFVHRKGFPPQEVDLAAFYFGDVLEHAVRQLEAER